MNPSNPSSLYATAIAPALFDPTQERSAVIPELTAEAPRPHRSGYIPALDGLRGIAVIGVLLFHLRLRGFSLGWSGVELFFVLSGFLITRILFDTRDNPKYFKNFYIRRALRIFPIYYIMLLAYAVVALLSGGTNLPLLSYYFVYLQTIPQLQTQFTAMPMLGHTWTLAIEEQFYFMWPLAILLLRGRRLLAVIAGIILLGLGLRIASLAFANPFLIDGWLGVQVDALAAGAMVAYALRTWRQAIVRKWLAGAFVLGAASLLALVGMVGGHAFWTPLVWGRAWWGPLLISLLACMFAGAVGLVAIGNRWFRWLEIRPLTQVGKISYGIYLYHPFTFLLVEIAFRRFGFPERPLASAAGMIAKLAITYLVARLSWKAVESPINKMKDRFTK